MNKKTLVKRVVKMIEKKNFSCSEYCPRCRRYSCDQPYLKGEENFDEGKDTCYLCRKLFSDPALGLCCPCTSWNHNLDMIRKQVYKVAEEVLG